MPFSLSIIIPMLNEAQALPDALASLLPLQRSGIEVIFVDGDSEDNSVSLAEAAGFPVIRSVRGRARQMNAGAGQARGAVLLFLHADTRLPAQAERLIRTALASGRHSWGRFDVRIQGKPHMLAVVAWMMNLRSRLSGIATGDQALFVRRETFRLAGGFPDQPLMEDVELSRRLLRDSRPACIRQPVLTSGRRWESRGVWRTIILMWQLRWAYWRGVSAETLARRYR